MKILFIISLCSIACALWVFTNATHKPKLQPKVKKRTNDKYKVPVTFWDDYNWLSMKIYKMERNDCDNVQARINEFIYKYEQIIDFNIFNDKVSCLLSSYQRRINFLLNNKHLTNGTSI